MSNRKKSKYDRLIQKGANGRFRNDRQANKAIEKVIEPLHRQRSEEAK